MHYLDAQCKTLEIVGTQSIILCYNMSPQYKRKCLFKDSALIKTSLLEKKGITNQIIAHIN